MELDVFTTAGNGQGGDELAQYIISKSGQPYKPKADAEERWVTRMVANGWHQQGEAGAGAYLQAYGRGISADKCIMLARHCELKGYPAVARGFWRRAFEVENKRPPAASPAQGAADPIRVTEPVGALAGQALPTIGGLPDHLQPGRLVTQQPVDALQPREYYVHDDGWWGQPKRDGERRPVMAGDQVCYQARSLALRAAPSPAIDRALAQVARERGPFVVDAEEVYYDAEGGEHRSAAQAVTANLNSGHAGVPPRPRLAIFKALFLDGQDLTGRPESERIAAGEDLGRALTALTEEIEVVPTARTTAEKEALVARQQAERREGEVWVRSDCTYTGGKAPAKKSPVVRTKYIPTIDVVVLGLTESTAAERAFGAIRVGEYINGRLVEIGSIGTGYTRAQMEEIAAAHAAAPGQVVITVGSQGRTEGGRLWQGRFCDLRSDKRPEECVGLEVGDSA